MENISKALTMAGGVLIAVLVIGALMLMFNQIGSYEKAHTSNIKDSQLAQFNIDFERYTDDNGITGADIISIINKVTDYNRKEGITNSVDYDIKMSVTVSGLDKFKSNYGIVNSDSLFKNITTLTINQNQNRFVDIINTYSNYEREYTLSIMSKLASNYDEIKNSGYPEGTQKYNELIKKIVGKNINNIPSLTQIKQYKEYSEFKSATFKSNRDSVYVNGQISELYFEFVK